jgi:hypothetical protein
MDRVNPIGMNAVDGKTRCVGRRPLTARGLGDANHFIIDVDIGNEKGRSEIYNRLSGERPDVVSLLSGSLCG